MSHERMVEQAAKHGYPLALAKVAVNAYRMERAETYQSHAAAVYPSRGIVAGDSLSDALVKLYITLSRPAILLHAIALPSWMFILMTSSLRSVDPER